MSGQQGDRYRDPRRAGSEHRIVVPPNPFGSRGAPLCPGTGHISVGKPLLRQEEVHERGREQSWVHSPMGCLPQPAPMLCLCWASSCCKLTGTRGLTKPPLLPDDPTSTQPCLRAPEAHAALVTTHRKQTPGHWARHCGQRPTHCPQHRDELTNGARCLSEHC